MLMTILSFLRKEKSALELIITFDTLSLFSGLKINKENCEIASIAVKDGEKVALCGNVLNVLI